jgi:hypothetical protein
VFAGNTPILLVSILKIIELLAIIIIIIIIIIMATGWTTEGFEFESR